MTSARRIMGKTALLALFLFLSMAQLASPADCRGQGQACNDDWECCAGTCSGRACSLKPGDTACAHNWECASGACMPSTMTCAQIGCKAGGQQCVLAADCCSGNCLPSRTCSNVLNFAGDPCSSGLDCNPGHVCNSSAGKCYGTSGLRADDGGLCVLGKNCKSDICDTGACRSHKDGSPLGSDPCNHGYDCGSGSCIAGTSSYYCSQCSPLGNSCTGGTNIEGNCCPLPSQSYCTGSGPTCQSCVPEGSMCAQTQQCCGSLICSAQGRCSSPTNLPPTPAPPAPVISPESVPANGAITCTHNCPPLEPPLPQDPENGVVTYEYVWYVNSQPIQEGQIDALPSKADPFLSLAERQSQPHAPIESQSACLAGPGTPGSPVVFSCFSNGCVPGDRIRLAVKACDPQGACSSSPLSNQVTVISQNNLPPTPAPPTPTLSPQSVAVNGIITCASGCPPTVPPLPADPEGQAVTYQYVWYVNMVPDEPIIIDMNPWGKNSQSLAEQVFQPAISKKSGVLLAEGGGSQWQSNTVTFDCLAKGCVPGDKIRLVVKACDPQGACSSSGVSSQVSVACSGLNEYCAISQHCCGSMSCEQATHSCKNLGNNPPLAPARPAISPMTSFVNSEISCASNCPDIPADPEGDHLTLYYRWYKNGVPWADGWVEYGSSIIIVPPEEELAKGAAIHDGAASFAASDYSGISGAGSHSAHFASPNLLPPGENYDCWAEGCDVGDTIALQTKACDPSGSGTCTFSEMSFASTVVCGGNLRACHSNADCCTGYSCSAGKCSVVAQIPPQPPTPIPEIVSIITPFYPDGSVHCSNCPLAPGQGGNIQGAGAGSSMFGGSPALAAHFSSASGAALASFDAYVPPPIIPPHVEYRWISGSHVSQWGTYSDLSCPAIGGCQPFQPVLMQARTCTQSGACSSLVQSNILTPEMFPLPPVPPIQVCDEGGFSHVFLMCLLAGMAMACIIALAYMGAEATNNARVLAWSKEEALQLFVSIVFVSAILFVLTAMCNVKVGEIPQFFGVSTVPAVFASPNDVLSFQQGATIYLEHLGSAGLANMAQLRYMMAAYELRTTYTQYVCKSDKCLLSMASSTQALFAGDSARLAIANGMLSSATVSELSIIFQYFTLMYITNGLFVNLLPLAMVIRSVPFMRQFGGALIAIFVALYIMYPAMIVLDAYLVPSLANGLTPSIYIKSPQSGGAYSPASQCLVVEAPFTEKSASPPIATFTRVVCVPPTKTEEDLTDTSVVGISEAKMEEILEGAPDFDQAVKFNALIFLTAVFLPAVNFIVVAALARDLSRFLGDEADISRLGQMI